MKIAGILNKSQPRQGSTCLSHIFLPSMYDVYTAPCTYIQICTIHTFRGIGGRSSTLQRWAVPASATEREPEKQGKGNLDTIAIGSTYISNLYVNRVTYGLWLEETLCRKETSLNVSIRMYGVLIVFTLYLYRYNIHKILDVSTNA